LKRTINSLALLLLAAAFVLPLQPGGAAPAAAETGGAAGPGLKGGVQKVELSLEQLRDVGLDLKQVLKGASSLYDEVTIQPVTIVTQPDVVGPGIVINIPVATMPAGPRQPARKDRVDRAMAQIRPTIDYLKKDVDEFLAGSRQLDLPDEIRERLKPEFQAWVEQVNAAAAGLARLDQLTAAPPYDNDAIASLSVDLQKSVKRLDSTRRAIYKVIRKEGKRLAAYQQAG